MWNTDETVRIAGISGSLRSASFSTGLLGVLARKAAPAMEIEVLTLDGIPLYNEEVEHEPAIAAIANFKRAIAESDGVPCSWKKSATAGTAARWKMRRARDCGRASYQ